jgi:hypothetical protein
MKDSSQSLIRILTLLSLASASIPLSIYGLWIYVFDLGNTQAERVAIFQSYFPGFLHGRWDTTIVSIVFCIAAIILSSISLKFSTKLWKALNILILAISCLLLALNVFSMM